jgi:dihydrofolate reductase
MFKIIACINEKGAIGKDGNILYHIKNDLTNFKNMTVGNVVIMGRKTFESLPNGKPLPDRINIILTSDIEYGVEPSENVFITNSIQDTVELCEALFPDKEWFVIGGESIYKQFMELDLVSEMRLTVVRDDMDGDSFFPEFSEEEWKTYYKSLTMYPTDHLSFYFHILKKKAADENP